MGIKHKEGCTFKGFSQSLSNYDPYGPDQSLSIDEDGILFNANINNTKDDDGSVSVFFHFCPVCGGSRPE